jgi:hypothetical protein
MRKMLAEVTPPMWILGGIILIYITSMLLRTPCLPKQWLYPIVRDITKVSVLYKMEDLQVQESEHFIIKYRIQDKAEVPLVIEAAEQAYQPVTGSLGHIPKGKPVIIIVSDRQEMQKTFGWSVEQSAMGVFWVGLIEVLSPQVWIAGDDAAAQREDFIKNGPIAHELTHLVVDSMVRGNYPRWFTEGLAQYQEYRLNEYEWMTATNSLGNTLYTLEQMEADFDGMDNQSLAYRESLAAVRYLYEVHGDDSVRAILHELNRGKTMRMAVQSVLHMDYGEFEKAWQQWGREHMPHPTVRRSVYGAVLY